ncbi:MAG: hypothetical protein ACREQI_13350, partial [Candidatus Binataceae bacterium]
LNIPLCCSSVPRIPASSSTHNGHLSIYLGAERKAIIFPHPARMGFSGELLSDCGPDSPPAYQHWLWEKRRTKVPPGESWFYVNNIQPEHEASTIDAVQKRLGHAGQGFRVRIIPRF